MTTNGDDQARSEVKSSLGGKEPTQFQRLSPCARFGACIGIAVGAALGWYAGLNLLIPMGFAFLVGRILFKRVPIGSRPMVLASAIQAGQGLWMLLGILVLRQFGLTLVEAAILVGGALWLAFRPSTLLVGLLVCYQIAGLAMNVPACSGATMNTNLHKALLVHIVFRLAAIACMAHGLVKIGRQTGHGAAGLA